MTLIWGQSGCCQIYMSRIAASIESNSEPIEANNRLNCQRLLDLPEPYLTWFRRTPREAMATSGGLERVKVLLRSYEQSEQELAREQRRNPVSFQFLWDELGIPND